MNSAAFITASGNDAPAVSLLTDTLREAAARDASDIHIEPSEHDWRIRLRVNGALHVLRHPPPHLHDAFVTRIKVLARIDIAERRVPQDGRLRLTLPGARVGNYRVNSLSTLFGEKLVASAAPAGRLVVRSVAKRARAGCAAERHRRGAFARRTASCW